MKKWLFETTWFGMSRGRALAIGLVLLVTLAHAVTYTSPFAERERAAPLQSIEEEETITVRWSNGNVIASSD